MEHAVKRNEIPPARLRAAAVIAKVFGIRGELKIHSYSRSLEEFEKLDSVMVGKDEATAVERAIESVVARGEGIYVKFRDISDRTAAQSLIGHFLFVEEEQRRRLRSGEYFVDDLLGMTVLGADRATLGVLEDVVHAPAHDMYVVRTRGGEVMVPAVGEIIRTVDMKHRTITIDPPEGLFSGDRL